MTQRRQTATGAGGRSRTCAWPSVGRQLQQDRERRVVLGRQRLGAFEEGIAQLLLVEAARRRSRRTPGPPASRASPAPGRARRRTGRREAAARGEREGRRPPSRAARRTEAPGAPGGGARVRECREGLDAAGDHLLGDGEREPQVALALGSEDDAGHGRDPGLVEQVARGRARVATAARPAASGRGRERRAGPRSRSPPRAGRRRVGRAGSGSPLSTRRRTRCRGESASTPAHCVGVDTPLVV